MVNTLLCPRQQLCVRTQSIKILQTPNAGTQSAISKFETRLRRKMKHVRLELAPVTGHETVTLPLALVLALNSPSPPVRTPLPSLLSLIRTKILILRPDTIMDMPSYCQFSDWVFASNRSVICAHLQSCFASATAHSFQVSVFSSGFVPPVAW